MFYRASGMFLGPFKIPASNLSCKSTLTLSRTSPYGEHRAGAELRADDVIQEGENWPNIDWQEKIHGGI